MGWNGTSWSEQPIFAGSGNIYGVSCVSSSFCEAVGNSSDGSGEVLAWNGQSWSMDTTTRELTAEQFTTLSCPSTSLCEIDGTGGAYIVGTTYSSMSPSFAVTSVALPSGTLDTSYSTSLTATGGTSPYSWSIASGSLPYGLTLDSSTGVISGVPTSTGSYMFTVGATDSASPVDTAFQPVLISITASTPTTSTNWTSCSGSNTSDCINYVKSRV